MTTTTEALTLEGAAREVVAAVEAQRDAINGIGHPGREHDTVLREPRDPDASVHIYDTVGDCAACGGAQYGSDDRMNLAMGDLREALGMERRPWETR